MVVVFIASIDIALSMIDRQLLPFVNFARPARSAIPYAHLFILPIGKVVMFHILNFATLKPHFEPF